MTGASRQLTAVIPPIFRKHWPRLAVRLGFAGLAAVAYLQIKATAEVSRSQAATMRSALEGSVRQFEQAMGRELAYLLGLFEPMGRGNRPEPRGAYAASRALWARMSAHPQLLRRLLVASNSSSGSISLMELPPTASDLVTAEWENELAPVRDLIASMSGARDPRVPAWMLVPEARAIVRPVADASRLRRIPGPPRFVPSGFLILVLDWPFATGELLPDLANRAFGDDRGEPLYHVALAERASGEILFRSDDALDSAWLARADVRHRVRLFGEAPARGPGPAAQPERRLRIAPGGSRGRRPAEFERTEPFGRRLLSFGRSRIVLVGDRPEWNVEIAASHVDGTISSIVDRQRLQSLAAGLGALGVLGVAMVFLVVLARRASRLARMQLEFVAGISHELRTPLSVICSVGENLSDGVVGAGTQARRYGDLILEQGRRLSDMVEQTLQFAAMESGKRRFQIESVDTSEAVRTALERARPMIDDAGFALEHSEGVDLPPVRADSKAMQQILSNLLSNAVKYGEPGRWIRVETGVSGATDRPNVEIRVRDRGMGIPESESRRVFEAFYRGREATQMSIRGSGLGLKLARDLALGMRGRLSLASEPGQGSEFTLQLPAEGEPER